jgi:hypothetical protein
MKLKNPRGICSNIKQKKEKNKNPNVVSNNWKERQGQKNPKGGFVPIERIKEKKNPMDVWCHKKRK